MVRFPLCRNSSILWKKMSVMIFEQTTFLRIITNHNVSIPQITPTWDNVIHSRPGEFLDIKRLLQEVICPKYLCVPGVLTKSKRSFNGSTNTRPRLHVWCNIRACPCPLHSRIVSPQRFVPELVRNIKLNFAPLPLTLGSHYAWFYEIYSVPWVCCIQPNFPFRKPLGNKKEGYNWKLDITYWCHWQPGGIRLMRYKDFFSPPAQRLWVLIDLAFSKDGYTKISSKMPPKKSQKRPAADEATTPRLQKRKIDGKDVAQPQVLINVNMVTKTGESSLTHCITLNGGSFNKDTVTLKNIRQLLIKEKALTLSRYGRFFPMTFW